MKHKTKVSAVKTKVTVIYWDYRWTGKLNKTKRPKKIIMICTDFVRLEIGADKKAIAMLFPVKGIAYRKTIEQIKKITFERMN